LVDACDSLAYDTHDTDDALGIGLISLADLDEVELWARAAGPVRARYPDLRGDSFRTAVVRELIAWQVGDLIEETGHRLAALGINSVADVRARPTPVVGFAPELTEIKAAYQT